MKAYNGRQIIQKAIEKYGKTMQSIVACEELAELQQAISKMVRGCGDLENLAEEIADVNIMIEQVCIMYGVTRENVDRYIRHKMSRLAVNLGMDWEDRDG